MRLNRTPLSLLLLSLTFLGLAACGSGDSDETSPLLEVNPFNQDLRTQELTLSGQIEPGADIEIDISTRSGGATSGNVEIFGPENGIWSARITELAKGDTSLVNITATDDTGNMTQTSFSVQVTLVPGVESVTYSSETRDFEARFVEVVDWETVNTETFYIVKESDNSELVGTITPENDGHVFRFVPDSGLAAGEYYKVILTSGIADVEGNVLNLGEDSAGENLSEQFWRIYIPPATQ